MTDRTSKLRLDIPFQKGRHQSKRIPDNPTKDQTNSDRTPKLKLARRSWTSQLIPDSLGLGSLRQHRPTGDIQGQTRQPQRPDIQTQTEQPRTRHSSSDCTVIASGQTFQLRRGSPRPARLSLDSSRPDVPAQTGEHRSVVHGPDIPAQIRKHRWTVSRKHPSSDLKGQL